MSSRSDFTRGRAAPLALLLAATLAACGGSGKETQVAVRVNRGEISVHQVQAVLQRQSRQGPGAQPEQATRRALDLLVEQELAAQAGRAADLDKDPRVVQALEGAARELVARAYQDRTAANVTGPTSDEIDRYYQQHPQLFAQRRLYVLRETAIDPSADVARVEALIAGARSVEELERALREAGVKFGGRLLAEGAEDLPLTVLEKVAPLEAGQSVVVSAPGAFRIFTVVQAIGAPVDRRTANDAIATYLTNQRKLEAVSEAMKKLRSEARIEYVGNFAKASGAEASAPAAAPAASR